jgi:hypothetical protein
MMFLLFASYGGDTGFFVGSFFDRADALTVAQSRKSAGEAVSLRSLESMDARQRLSTMAGAARAFFSPMATLPGEEVPL